VGWTTWFDRFPVSRKVLLAEIAVSKRVVLWTPTGGYADTWDTTITERVESGASPFTVSGVQEDGVDLTERANIALVSANNASWYHDQTAGALYVNSINANPNNATILVRVVFRVANFAKTFSGVPYFPRILSAPAVSLRVPETFDGVGQLSGGQLNLANSDGFFDGDDTVEWDSRRVTLKMGLDIA